MNQRERFESAWRKRWPLGNPERATDAEFTLFQLGEAAGLELAAKVCDEWATQFEPSSMAPAIDHYSARLLQRLSKAIMALLARERK